MKTNTITEINTKEINESNITYINDYLKPSKKKKDRSSLLTSHGKPKAKEAESIKTKKEVKQFLQYFIDKKDYRNYLLFVLGISTAYRAGDLLTFKFKDIFENDKTTFKPNLYLYEQKTGKYREIEITNVIRTAVLLYTNSLDNFELEDYLFKSQKGNNKPLEVTSVHKLLKTAGRELKLPYNIGSHTMRKTYAYWFIKTHPDNMSALIDLMKMLNHSSEKITREYAGIAKEERKTMNRDVSILWENIITDMKS